MSVPYMNVIYVIVGAILLFLLGWWILRRLQRSRNLIIRDASLTVEELEAHARSMALEHLVTSQKIKLNWPVTRMNENFTYIRQVYGILNGDMDKKNVLPPGAEWLLDNYYIIEEQVSGLRKDLTKKSYFDLPVLKRGPYQGITRIFAMANEMVAHTHGLMDEDLILKYLEAYQSHNILFERELYAFPAMLRLALIENVRMIGEDILETRKQWNLADETVERWLAEKSTDPGKIDELFRNNGKAISEAIDTGNPSFVEHLFYRLRRSGRRYSEVLHYIDEHLDKYHTTTEIIAEKEHNAQAVSNVSMGNCIVSLKHLSIMNWSDLFDSSSYLEKILTQDPDGTYSKMDINSRFYYKNRVGEIAKTYGVSELYIAKEALTLARNAGNHIGYFIIGEGVKTLERRQVRNLKFFPKLRKNMDTHQGLLYMISVVTFTLLVTLLAIGYGISHLTANQLLYGILIGAVIAIPVSEIGISIVNWLVCKVKKPAVFPKLELREGIPDSMSAMVVIPALLSDKKRVGELMENMENHYLGNKEKNLYFALIGAFRDSDAEKNKEDQGVIQEASDRIKALNRQYADGGKDIFYFYNRQRKFNEIDNNWTGWERKRGALMEFNDLLLGAEDTSFSFYSNELLPDANIKYVITLDADTVLPLGMAKKMIGTMAHPLNKPVIDREKGIVTRGYGLIQPRVSFDSDSSNRSFFSRIYTGQEGLDPYASAISDVYQDLFGEGIFTGKGIYDLNIFQEVLKGTLPENAILSHDLLEGSFVRAALVSDLELVDAYPSKYNSFMARLHRWIRGDWQLIPWLLPVIQTKDRTSIKNPLSSVSKWKMMDNLRRSLLTPAVMILITLGLTILPGSGGFWVGLGVAAMGAPLVLSLLTQMISGGLKPDSIKRHLPGFFGIKASIFQFFLSLIFLPYQAFMALDAILVTLIRVFFTKKNMLEWVTSSDADRAQPNSMGSYISTMGLSGALGIPLAGLTFLAKPDSLVLSLVLLVAWLASPVLAYYISKDVDGLPEKMEDEDLLELRKIARKTWRYFEELANQKNNFLAPDNFQEEPHRGVAHKTSPTNIGLGLMATMTARDMGYIGIAEGTALLSRTIETIEKMDKWEGHLYNWYDTRTLEPLFPRYVSTVDSGNLVGYLITLSQGLKEYKERPLIDPSFASGILDTARIGLPEGQGLPSVLEPFLLMEKQTMIHPLDWNRALDEWIQYLEQPHPSDRLSLPWKEKSLKMARAFKREIHHFMPWVEKTQEPSDSLIYLMGINVTLMNLPDLNKKIIRLCELPEEEAQAAEKSLAFSTDFLNRYDELIGRIDQIAINTRFQPLYNSRRHLFYIGYNIEEIRATNSYYDLLASEARQTSYIAIARGEVPPKHWFMLGRSLTVVDRYKGLVSWSGTMFEYLMPLLLMRSYKNTLLDETYSFAVKSQVKYGKQREMPWGTSESAYNAMDINLDYQYKAIGVPWLGLKRGLAQDAVIAPYATFLALMVDPAAAYKNLMRLKEEGMEGTYGFYEAADYTQNRLEPLTKKTIIKSFMAHHQGMSLVAVNNYLNDYPMQKRFAKEPCIRAARLLLQEKVPLKVVFTKGKKEKILNSKLEVVSDQGAYRRFTAPDFELPKTHVLSNGHYFLGLTDQGTGYSRTRDMDLTRWRADPINESYGTFFYIQNLDTNRKWSAAYAPLRVMPENYEVIFTPDRASYKRKDGDLETLTEVVVASGDTAEIRRVILKNNGMDPCTLQVTSYMEIVGASHDSDMAHPAFSNLFVSTEFDSQARVLLANRRTRSPSDKKRWIAAMAVTKEELIGDMEIETDRAQFIGRGRTVANPEIMEGEMPLSNTVGSVLDPIFSMRTRIRIEAGNTARIYFVTATADSKESALELIEKYNNGKACNEAFWLAMTRSQVEAKYLNIKAREMELYQELISHILFISPQRRNYARNIQENRQGQQTLWQYGISGDRPMVLLVLEKTDEMELLYELLKAHEYWRLKDLKVDLVIMSREENSYGNPVNTLIKEIIHSTQTQDQMNRHRDIFLLKTSTMTEQEINLLYAASRLIFEGGHGTMAEQIPAGSPPPDFERWIRPGKMPLVLKGEPITEPQFFNGLGGFGEDGKSYIIHLEKKQMTPAPWINVIANPEFGFMVSESGGGYTWSENSRENKLTKWSNDPVSDPPGEVFYISDESGELWSMTPLPIREEEPYRIEHGFGYTKFQHESHGISQELVQFVPPAGKVKISTLRFHNESQEERRLWVTYYMTPIMGVSMKETGLHLVSSQEEEGALLFENPYNQEFPDRVCFVDASVKERSITGDRKSFFGRGNFASPEALDTNTLSGEVGAGYDPCGAMQLQILLEANETKEIVFVMGMADSRSEANGLANQFKTVPLAAKALEEVQSFWKDKLEAVQVYTPDTSMNIMLNGWLLYQTISCRMMARSGFYQAGGAYGFRDQLQDSLSLAATWPEMARAQILKHGAHQFEEGDVMHWWHEPAGKGTRTRISDDYLWLPFVTAEYIRIAGDADILNSPIAYLQEEPLKENEEDRYCQPGTSLETFSLYDHCIRAIGNGLRFGAHHLPLIRGGDWNDGMNGIGREGKGESVWLGWFLYTTLQKFIPICLQRGEQERAEEYGRIAEKLKEDIEAAAWDGSWYIRAFYDDGTPLGTADSRECKIDALAQSWSVLSGAGDPARGVTAMGSLENYLIMVEEGIIKLLTPPFMDGNSDPGYIKGYLPGVRENGGQYTHAATWTTMAFAKQGEGTKAWNCFRMLNPINHTRTGREAWIYKGEPYVMAADVYSEPPHVGRGGWTWYTGSAGWMYKSGLESILGFYKQGETLIVDPSMPERWKEYAISYRYRETTYEIRVSNPDGFSRGVRQVLIDGQLQESPIIGLMNDGGLHQVEVLMGI